MSTKLNNIEESLCHYIFHLVRGKHQRTQFLSQINNLKKGETIVVDYMTRLLFQRLHEPQKDWFGKKGVSLHGAIFIFCNNDDRPLVTEFHDNLSENDDKQNWFFSASSIEQSVLNFRKLHPEIVSATIWSENGAHYKNTSVFNSLAWQSLEKKTGMRIKSCNNFEAQTGKTILDSHYAVLKFSLKSYRHEGHDILTPKDIVEGTERLRGTNVYKISINRSKEPQSAKTWQGISNYFSFVYVYSDDGECREVKAQEQTGVGPSTTLTRRHIKGLWSESRSDTGSTSELDLTKGQHKAPLIDKNKTAPVAPEQQQQIQTQETDNNIGTCDDLIKCRDCGASFLRPGNLHAHKESKVCKNRQKTKRALAASQNVIKEDEIVNLSLPKQKHLKIQLLTKVMPK